MRPSLTRMGGGMGFPARGPSVVAVPDGLTIANKASTTVTAAAPYWNVERTTGGGAYDAAAISTDGIVGDFLVTIRRLAGTFIAGVSADPTLDNGFGNIIGFLSTGAAINAYSYGADVGGPFANKEFMFLRWDTAVDSLMRLYTGDTAVFGDAGAAVDTVDLTGFEATSFKFKACMNTASSELQASMVAM